MSAPVDLSAFFDSFVGSEEERAITDALLELVEAAQAVIADRTVEGVGDWLLDALEASLAPFAAPSGGDE